MVRVTEQRFADQVRTILKSKWFTAVELEEIKRNMHRNCEEQNGTAIVEEANDGNEHEPPVEDAKDMESQKKKPGYRVNGVMKDLGKMSEDQLMIWKRLNDIRLNQDLEGKVPALKGIPK